MKKIIYALLLLVIVACTKDVTEKSYYQLKSENIRIPNYSRGFVAGKDTIVNDFLSGKAKMIVFCDSSICNTCAIEHIYRWQECIDCTQEYGGNLSFFFIFTPRKNQKEDICIAMEYADFDYPLLLDTAGLFRKMNPHIPTDKKFFNFLLNDKNEVVMVGDPTQNEKVMSLFKNRVKSILK